MGEKRDRVTGALKRSFAQMHGKSLRWAQMEAANGSARWQAFLADQFQASSGMEREHGDVAVDAGRMGGGVAVGASDLERAGQAKESAWRTLSMMEGQLEMAVQAGDVVLIASFTRAVREARTNWERAGLHEQRLMEASGSLVPVHVFHEVRTRGIAPLAELMGQQRDFIGSRLEAGVRVQFCAAWDEWSREWNRKLDDLSSEVNGILSHV